MNVLLKAAETAAGCEGVHVVVAEEVVGLVGVSDEQFGSQERARHLVITNRLKARTFWSRLIERKLNSLKRGKVVQVVVAFGVACLKRVDKEQAGSPERALCLECIMKRLLKVRTFLPRFKGRPSSL